MATLSLTATSLLTTESERSERPDGYSFFTDC